MTDLTTEQLASVKKSYFNILALFLGKEQIESRYLRCLLKWGFHLHLSPEDLKLADVDILKVEFTSPDNRADKLESIYHLVCMIYLDKIVEDVELEVATTYAEKLGFSSSVVNELFNSIATEDYDQMKPGSVRQEVMDFLSMENSPN